MTQAMNGSSGSDCTAILDARDRPAVPTEVGRMFALAHRIFERDADRRVMLFDVLDTVLIASLAGQYLTARHLIFSEGANDGFGSERLALDLLFILLFWNWFGAGAEPVRRIAVYWWTHRLGWRGRSPVELELRRLHRQCPDCAYPLEAVLWSRARLDELNCPECGRAVSEADLTPSRPPEWAVRAFSRSISLARGEASRRGWRTAHICLAGVLVSVLALIWARAGTEASMPLWPWPLAAILLAALNEWGHRWIDRRHPHRPGALDRAQTAFRLQSRCPACLHDLMHVPADPADGCTVCPECGGAWRLPAR